MQDFLDDLPSFDDLLKRLAAVIGVPGVVIALLSFVLTIASYYGPVRTALRVGHGAGRGVATVARSAMASPLRFLIGLVAALIVLIGQALTIVLCYIGGNFLATLFDRQRDMIVTQQIEFYEFDALKLDVARSILQLDWYSGGNMIAGGLGILWSYWRAIRYRDDRQYGPFVLCSLPILITFILSTIAAALWATGAVLITLLGLLSFFFSGEWGIGGYFSDRWPFFLFGLILTALLGFYTYTCWLSVRGSTAVATIFRGR